jgi:tetratricopeptide (TPR) repeat protein
MTQTRRWCLVLSFVVVLVGAGAGGAGAATGAKALFESGTSHYNLNEFDEALRDFKEAYRIRPDPVFLFNIAQCYRQLGDPKAAASFYRSYRRELPNAPNRAEVDRLIDEMDRAQPTVKVSPPSVPAEPASPPAQQLGTTVPTCGCSQQRTSE